MKNFQGKEFGRFFLSQSYKCKDWLLILITCLGIFLHLINAYATGELVRDETRVMSIYHYVINTSHWALNRHIVDINDLSELVTAPTATKQGTYAWLLAIGHGLGFTPGTTDFLLDALGIVLFFTGWLIIFWRQSSSLIYRVGLPTLAFWTFAYSPLTVNLASGNTTAIFCIGAVTIVVGLLVKSGKSLDNLRVMGCGCLIGISTLLRISNLAVAVGITIYIFLSKGQTVFRKFSIALLFASTAISPGIISYIWRKQAISQYADIAASGWPRPVDVAPDLTRLSNIIPWPINSIGLFDSSLFANSLYRVKDYVNWTVNPQLATVLSIILIGLAFCIPISKRNNCLHKNLWHISIWITLVLIVELGLIAVIYSAVEIPGRIEQWTTLLEVRYLDIPISFMLPLILLNVEKLSSQGLKNKARFACILILAICTTASQPQILLLGQTPTLFNSLPKSELHIQSLEVFGRKVLGDQLFSSKPPTLVAYLIGGPVELRASHGRAMRGILTPLGFRTSRITLNGSQNDDSSPSKKACTSSPQELAIIIPFPEHQDWPTKLDLWIAENQNHKVFSSDSYSTFIFDLDINSCIALP